MSTLDDHNRLAETVRRRLSEASGKTSPELRRQSAARAAGAAAVPQPYDALARQIGEAAARVTDAQVAAVRETTGSDAGAFEIVMAAAIGAGLMRWDAASAAIAGANDAAA